MQLESGLKMLTRIKMDKIMQLIQDLANILLLIYITLTITAVILVYRFEKGTITRDDNPDKITIFNGRIEIVEPLIENGKEDGVSSNLSNTGFLPKAKKNES